MRAYADIANLHARICAMRSRLLSDKDYEALMRDPDSFSYPKVRDPAKAKELLFKDQIGDIIRLAEAVSIYAPLFVAFLRQYEAYNVKQLLSRALGRATQAQWYDIGPYALFERGLLEQSPGLSDLRDRLAGTYLEEAFAGHTDPGHLLIQVDLCAVRDLYNASSSLPRAMQAECRHVIVRRVAVLALVWRIRLRDHYHWPEARIHNYLAATHDLFGRQLVSQTASVREGLSARLAATGRGSAQPTVSEMEYFLEQEYYRWTLSMFHHDFHSGYGVIAYLWLLFCQIRNLMRIIDARRFDLPAEAVRIVHGT